MIVRRYKLDVDAAKLNTLAGTPITSTTPASWSLRDNIVIGIDVYRLLAGVETAMDLTDVVEYRLMVKDSDDLQGDAYVISLPAAWNDTDDWADASAASGKICTRIALTGVELIALYATDDDYIDFTAEIEARDVSGRATTLCRFGVRILQDAIQGGEDVPDAVPGAGWRAITVDGAPYLAWLFPDEKWRYLMPQVVDGIPTHAWVEYV